MNKIKRDIDYEYIRLKKHEKIKARNLRKKRKQKIDDRYS